MFLDYDELTDGIFKDKIKEAIQASPFFLIVMSKGSMTRCVNEGDWVRREIFLALEHNKHIIPVNPDNSFDGFPEEVPNTIKELLGSHQFSDINFGQALGVTIDLLIQNRLLPTLGKREVQNHKDEDYATAQETLRKMDLHNRFMKRLGIIGISLIVLIVLAVAGIFLYQQKVKNNQQQAEKERLELRTKLEQDHSDFQLRLDQNLTKEQMYTIDTILQNMTEVRQDSLWVSKFEFTVGQWYGILGGEYDCELRKMPMTEVSFGDVCMKLLDTLRLYTGITGFDLPSVEEWEYAAHGGCHHETTLYVGSDNVDEAAWYQGNSRGKAHQSDGRQGKICNWLDIFDMSGNVAEWCNSPQIIDGGVVLMSVCGGHYNSPASEVTASSRAGLDPDAREKTVGFRLIIRKN